MVGNWQKNSPKLKTMLKCSEIFSNSFYPPKIGELVFKEGICDKMFHLNFLV